MGVKSDQLDNDRDRLWRIPNGTPALGAGEIHLWRVALDRAPAELETLSSRLSPEEQVRAARFYRASDRDHFRAARGAMREILGAYLGVAPGRIEFSYNEYGKPALAGNGLRFNLSHSGGLALLAVAAHCEVGVDIELIREDFASLEIAERFFSTRETAALKALPPEERTTAFFRCWTRKEAYIKAIGEGLSRSLQSFSVSIQPSEPVALLESEDDPLAASRWTLIELFPGKEYMGAVAVEGTAPTVCCWAYGKKTVDGRQ
jgi:4'-phosphopantetheinyl transferase